MLKEINRRDWGRFASHLTVILLIFVLPELMFRASRPHMHPDGLWTFLIYLKTALFIGVFYVNYFVLIDKYLFGERRSVLKYIGINLIMVVGLTGAMYVLQRWGAGAGRGHQELGRMAVLLRTGSFFFRDLGMMLLTIALSAALKFGERWTSIEERHDRMMASQREEELKSLKSQLNPHFLFNTLNTIYALIAVSPDQAQEAVHQLSTLLRHMLYENPASVKLSREIEFVRSYISLMDMRLNPGAVSASFSAGSDPQVAPLLFISLIENAFKHGNTGCKDHKIIIDISADENGRICCRTSNHFLPKPDAEKKPDGGIGIANLRRRLQLLYPGQASLVTHTEGNIYTATLTINTTPQQ